jgi:hypothetical protein
MILDGIKGFEMVETMEGYHCMPAISDKNMDLRFKVKWGTENLKEVLNPSSKQYLMFQMAGVLEAEGIVDKTRAFGYLHLNYPEHKLQYALQFKSAERPPENDYMLIGEKMNVQWWNLPVSHTTCYTTIINGADQLISRGVVFFKLKNAWPFIKSLKLYKE